MLNHFLIICILSNFACFYCHLALIFYVILFHKLFKKFQIDWMKIRPEIYLRLKGVSHFNPYKPSVFFVGHRQTMQTQIRHRMMRCLIRIFTVCLQNNLSKFEKKKRKIQPKVPKLVNGLVLLIRIAKSILLQGLSYNSTVIIFNLVCDRFLSSGTEHLLAYVHHGPCILL